MSKIFITSDTHFCHDKEFVWQERGFNSVDEMNEAIVERWNSVVTDEDTVYHLGDVMLNDNDKGLFYLGRLKGKIIILNGNHDTARRILAYDTLPNVHTIGYVEVIKYRGYTFYLSHYPTLTSNNDEDKPLKARVINLHGHTHQKTNFTDGMSKVKYHAGMYHVGMDSHNCTPVELDVIIDQIKEADILLKLIKENK